MQILISFVRTFSYHRNRSFSYHRIPEFGLYQFFFSFLDTIDCNHSGTHCIFVNTGKGKVVPQLFVVALLFMIVCSSFQELCAYPMIIRFKALYHKHGVNILILMGFFLLENIFCNYFY